MSRGWLLLFGLIGASLIPLVLGGSDMFSRLRAFPLDSLLLMFGMIVVCWFINGLRLRLLLAGRAGKLGQLQSVGIIMASEFAFCATPGGSGGPLTLMALLARRGLRPAQTSAVFAVDQLADLTFFLCALGAILIYALSHSLSPNMESSLIFSAVFLVGLFVGAVMLIRYLHQVIRFNGRVLARLGVSSRKRLHWGRKILHFRIALHDSLRLPKRRLLAVFLLSSTHWLLRFSVLDLTRGPGIAHVRSSGCRPRPAFQGSRLSRTPPSCCRVPVRGLPGDSAVRARAPAFPRPCPAAPCLRHCRGE